VNTSKNRKVASLILGLAVTALVVDKLFLGGGATPTLAADGTLAPAAATSLTPAAAPLAAGREPGTLSVSSKLQQMSRELNLSADPALEIGPMLDDAFAPPHAMTEVVAAELARRALIERQAKAEEQAVKLRDQLKVSATITNGQPRAKINGTFYSLGSELPGTGFRIKEITRIDVLLEDTATQATVKLKLNPDL
jgi:hypothetical protein